MNRTQWTSAEIIYLTQAHFSGKRVKTIANDLNRSNMSISKALNRFNIKINSEEDTETLAAPLNRPSKPRVKEVQKRFQDDWISIARMIRWMKDNKFHLTALDRQKKLFKLNSMTVTLGQVLLNCNRLRLQNNLPIFRVKGITNV